MDIVSIISLVRRQTYKHIQHLRSIRKQARMRESNKERGIPDSIGMHERIFFPQGVALKVISNQPGE